MMDQDSSGTRLLDEVTEKTNDPSCVSIAIFLRAHEPCEWVENNEPHAKSFRFGEQVVTPALVVEQCASAREKVKVAKHRLPLMPVTNGQRPETVEENGSRVFFRHVQYGSPRRGKLRI